MTIVEENARKIIDRYKAFLVEEGLDHLLVPSPENTLLGQPITFLDEETLPPFLSSTIIFGPFEEYILYKFKLSPKGDDGENG